MRRVGAGDGEAANGEGPLACQRPSR